MATSSLSVSDSSRRYAAPPRVPWWALFIVLAVINVAARIYLPKSIEGFIPAIAIKTWAVYLCLWIRTLDPKATSIYWVVGSLLGDGVMVFLCLLPDPTPLVSLAIVYYALPSIAAGIAAIYIIRHELLKHYTEREPMGLFLSPIVTFFFSYIYFQYHLYDIAEAKRHESESLVR